MNSTVKTILKIFAVLVLSCGRRLVSARDQRSARQLYDR